MAGAFLAGGVLGRANASARPASNRPPTAQVPDPEHEPGVAGAGEGLFEGPEAVPAARWAARGKHALKPSMFATYAGDDADGPALAATLIRCLRVLPHTADTGASAELRSRLHRWPWRAPCV
jgi:hypothetical protein